MTSGAVPRRPTRRVRHVASLTGAVLALAAGWWVAVVLDARSAPAVTAVLLVVPVLAVLVPTHRLEPVARVVLAVGWVLALDTVVAQVMLVFGVWDVGVGVLVVTGISVAVWVGVELATRRGDRATEDRATETGPRRTRLRMTGPPHRRSRWARERRRRPPRRARRGRARAVARVPGGDAVAAQPVPVPGVHHHRRAVPAADAGRGAHASTARSSASSRSSGRRSDGACPSRPASATPRASCTPPAPHGTPATCCAACGLSVWEFDHLVAGQRLFDAYRTAARPVPGRST